MFLPIFLASIGAALCCDVKNCAYMVSKCIFLGACNCTIELEDCSCCDECKTCLGRSLFTQCACQCLGKNCLGSDAMSENTVHLLDMPIPSLFDALTETKGLYPWMPQSVPQFSAMTRKYPNGIFSEKPQSECPSVFFDSCMPMYKCSSSCSSMGSSVMRWFHNGCCNCFGGERCDDLGSVVPQCRNCVS